MFMSAYMLRMLLVLVYMLRLLPVSTIVIALHNMLLIVLVVLPNMLLHNMLLIVLVVLPNMLMLMNMRAMSAYAFANANVWNFRINNRFACHEFVKLCLHKCPELFNGKTRVMVLQMFNFMENGLLLWLLLLCVVVVFSVSRT